MRRRSASSLRTSRGRWVLGIVLAIGAAQAIPASAEVGETFGKNASYGARLSVGYTNTCAIAASGRLWCWGNNDHGQLGDGTFTSTKWPTKVKIGKVTSVSVGYTHACAVTTSAELMCWGWDQYSTEHASTPVRVKTQSGLPLTNVWVGPGTGICVGDSGGGLECLSPSFLPSPFQGWRPPPPPLPKLPPVAAYAGSIVNSCVLAISPAHVLCWGSNELGGLGNGQPVGYGAPVSDTAEPVIDAHGQQIADFVALSADEHHFCAISSSRGTMCWGRNHEGQLGRGFTSYAEPVAATVLQGATSVATGLAHSCTLVNGGTACWGDDTSVQLDGNGSSAVPIQVRGPYLSITAGHNVTCGWEDDQTVSCWGSRRWGNLGQSKNIIQ